MICARVGRKVLGMKAGVVVLGLMLAAGQAAVAQDAAKDAVVEAASQMMGRALFLRCFCSEDNLSFDAEGHVAGLAKATDWTLAGVNVLKVERKAPGEIEFDGVRVAIRFATDRREFDRHPQNDEKMKIVVADTGDATAFEHALKSVFSTGIDRLLQQNMPEFWQHYFDPGKPWPPDSLTGQTIEVLPAPTPTASVAAPTHKSEAGYTSEAAHDRVAGQVRLRLVVDADGVPKRIAVVQPLGYGLDERAVEALEKYRFTPAMVQERPVASNVTIDEEFVVVASPR
jgi:TonB family protein